MALVVETAFKAACMAYRARERGEGADFTKEEMGTFLHLTDAKSILTVFLVDSCMENKAPGSPELAILSFKSGFHGRLFGSLSATRSKAIHKVCQIVSMAQYMGADERLSRGIGRCPSFRLASGAVP